VRPARRDHEREQRALLRTRYTSSGRQQKRESSRDRRGKDAAALHHRKKTSGSDDADHLTVAEKMAPAGYIVNGSNNFSRGPRRAT